MNLYHRRKSAGIYSAIKRNSMQTNGLIGYWPLNEDGGLVANDKIGSNTGTIYSAVTRTPGPFGSAVYFSGTSSEITTTTQYTNPTIYSISLWFNTSTASGKKLFGFENVSTGTSASAWDRHIYIDTAGKITYGVYNSGSQLMTSTNSYADGVWHHVVVTQSASQAVMYIDGALITTLSSVSGANYSGYWRIGGYRMGNTWSTATDGYYTGSLADIRLYNRSLSAAEAQALYTNPLGIYKEPLFKTSVIRSSGVVYDVSFSQGVTNTFGATVSATMAPDCSYGPTLGLTFATITDFAGSLTLNQVNGITFESLREVLAFITLSNNSSISTAATENSNTESSFNVTQQFSIVSQATIESALALVLNPSFTSDFVLQVNASATFNNTLSLLSSALGTLNAGCTFSHIVQQIQSAIADYNVQSLFTTIPQVVAISGKDTQTEISYSLNVNLATNSIVGDLQLILPDSRKIIIAGDNRKILISGDNRTILVQGDSRTVLTTN
jgi:hypothetical protein